MQTRAVVTFSAVTAGVAAYSWGPLFRLRTWWVYDDPLPVDPVVVGAFSVLAVASVVVLVTRRHVLPPWLIASAAVLAVWLVVTTAWSLDRRETVRESLLIAGTLASGAAAATLLDLRRLAWAVWGGLHVGLGWSFLAIWAGRPDTLDRNDDWAGVYFNRNSLGLYAALGLLISGLLAADVLWRRSQLPPRLVVLAIGILAAAALADARLLAGSNSATPVGALLASLVVGAGALVGRRAIASGVRRGRVVAVGIISAVAVGSVGFLTRSIWLGSVGRDDDLTGRTGLWALAWDWTTSRPLHGYGYLSVWDKRPYSREVRQETGRRLSSAHNSMVEMLVGGGFVGAALFLAFVAIVVWLVAMTAVGRRSVAVLWPLAVVAFALVENVTETLFVSNHLTVALLPAAATAAWLAGDDDKTVAALSEIRTPSASAPRS